MANPKVRPNMHFYPEDAGDTLEHAWQGRRWKDKIDPTLLTPMVRVGNQDFFVHEPAYLKNGVVCLPIRWFERDGSLFARAARMDLVSTDAARYWVVREDEQRELSITDFDLSFPSFRAMAASYDLPDPADIRGTISLTGICRVPFLPQSCLSRCGEDYRHQRTRHGALVTPSSEQMAYSCHTEWEDTQGRYLYDVALLRRHLR